MQDARVARWAAGDLRRLQNRVIERIPAASLLPPPTVIRVQLMRGGSEWAIEAGVDMNSADDDPDSECLEVTACLAPRSKWRPRPMDFARFRDWAVSHPAHPLATRYQLLYAWLLAARADSRFEPLVDAFIQAERRRLQQVVSAAARRLLSRRPLAGSPTRLLRRA